MKAPSKIKTGPFHIRSWAHPWIDPTDAGNAIMAKLRQSVKSRPSITLQHLLEDFFIAGLANKHPWTKEQVRQIEISSESKDFCERFARALEEGRSRIFDEIDVWLLCNWRKIRVPQAEKFIKRLPGLWEWSPRAACGLIEVVTPTLVDDASEAWYIKRPQRLGLKAKRPRVKDFLFRDGRVLTDICGASPPARRFWWRI